MGEFGPLVIAPQSFAGTLFFSDGQNSGWSETYYRPDQSYGTFSTALNALANNRAKFLHSAYSITGCRISDLSVFGDSFLPNWTFPIVGGMADSVFKRPPPDLATNLRIEAGPFMRGRKYIRGVILQEVNGEYAQLDVFDPLVAPYVQSLLQFSHLVKKKPPLVSELHPISNVVVVGMTRRKAGRPFGVPRGRRRRR